MFQFGAIFFKKVFNFVLVEVFGIALLETSPVPNITILHDVIQMHMHSASVKAHNDGVARANEINMKSPAVAIEPDAVQR